MQLLVAILRFTCFVLIGVLFVALLCWAAAAPLVWILRDGLAVGMVESEGAHAVARFMALWGLPALAFALPLAGLVVASRWLGKCCAIEPKGIGEP
jgi:hypothetical protein